MVQLPVDGRDRLKALDLVRVHSVGCALRKSEAVQQILAKLLRSF